MSFSPSPTFTPLLQAWLFSFHGLPWLLWNKIYEPRGKVCWNNSYKKAAEEEKVQLSHITASGGRIFMGSSDAFRYIHIYVGKWAWNGGAKRAPWWIKTITAVYISLADLFIKLRLSYISPILDFQPKTPTQMKQIWLQASTRMLKSHTTFITNDMSCSQVPLVPYQKSALHPQPLFPQLTYF